MANSHTPLVAMIAQWTINTVGIVTIVCFAFWFGGWKTEIDIKLNVSGRVKALEDWKVGPLDVWQDGVTSFMTVEFKGKVYDAHMDIDHSKLPSS